MLKKIVRKRYIFISITIAFGVMIYSTTASSQDTTILSDQEMSKIIGMSNKLCDELYFDDCKAMGHLTCTQGASCQEQDLDYKNISYAYCHYVDNPNPGIQKCTDTGTLVCSQLRQVITGQIPAQNKECISRPEIPEGWAAYWEYCSSKTGAECVLCSYGANIGPPHTRPNIKCQNPN